MRAVERAPRLARKLNAVPLHRDRMTRWTVALALCVVPVRAAVAQAPYRVTWWDAAGVAAGTASHALLVAVAGFAGLASADGANAAAVRGHVVVFANALAWTEATTQWIKVLAHRSRPVLYTSAAPAAASNRDNRRSFPSGHAAAAFSVATAYLAMARREHLPHRARNAVLLFAGATAVAALRVAAGQHFPTDVVGGAAIGGGVGWLVARVHPTAP